MSICTPPSAPLVVVLGSTGTGKSQLAVDLAVRFNGEIVNADAMQMYKGLSIITNKISDEEQRSVPHHLLANICLDDETWTVGVFKREANRIIQGIRDKGRLPIVVGGTHYYTSALLFKDSLVEKGDGSFESPPAHDHPVDHPILDDTTEAIWEKLKEIDPVMADHWHPNDRRKIRRSLEIFLTTGRRASEVYAEQKSRKKSEAAEQKGYSNSDSLLLWLHTDDQALKDRLNKRVDNMLVTGLMGEVREMSDYLQSQIKAGKSVDLSKGIWQSIGFKEFQPYLRAAEDGVSSTELDISRLECLEAMKTATRRYARYQVKWILKRTIPQLQKQGGLDRLYVLDSTDPSRYSENVLAAAASLTQQFLAGEAVPEPSSLSETAKKLLSSATDSTSWSQGTPCRKYCQSCDATLLTEKSWQMHIRGRPHQRRLRNAKRTALIPAPYVETRLVKLETTPSDPLMYPQ